MGQINTKVFGANRLLQNSMTILNQGTFYVHFPHCT